MKGKQPNNVRMLSIFSKKKIAGSNDLFADELI
jgi:hypothetical protein